MNRAASVLFGPAGLNGTEALSMMVNAGVASCSFALADCT